MLALVISSVHKNVTNENNAIMIDRFIVDTHNVRIVEIRILQLQTRKDPASQGSPPRAKLQYRAPSFWVTATAIDNFVIATSTERSGQHIQMVAIN